MGDSSDGSSSAAQGAQMDHDNSHPKKSGAQGFFSRIFSTGSPAETMASDPPRLSQEVMNGAIVPGMLNLRRLRVDDVAIPKSEITAVSKDISKAELVEVFRESGLTRLPVYEGTLDTPVGLVNLKDFALNHGFGQAGDFDLAAILRSLIYVPPSMPIGVLLQKMQAERLHMALVIDEYGGTDGLVTIEDLIEQVVGEIEDEHDIEEVRTFVLEKPGVYTAQARTELGEFEAELGFSLTEHADLDGEEVETLGGLVFMITGRVPSRGEVVTHPDGLEFEVLDADPRRVKRLRVRLPHAAE